MASLVNENLGESSNEDHCDPAAVDRRLQAWHSMVDECLGGNQVAPPNLECFQGPEERSQNLNEEEEAAIREIQDTFPIESLDDDVLRSILLFVNLPDIHHRVALISRKWKALTRDQRFAPKRVVFHNRSKRCFKNLRAVKFFGPSVEEMIIRSCYFRLSKEVKVLDKWVSRCDNLRKIAITNVEFRQNMPEFFRPLKYLKKLKVVEFHHQPFPRSDNNWCVTELFRFVTRATNVEELILRLNEMYNYNSVDAVPTHLKKLDVYIYQGAHTSSCELIKKLIKSNERTITELKLCPNFDDDFAELVTRCENLKVFSFLMAPLWPQPKISRYLNPLTCGSIELHGLRVYANDGDFTKKWSFFKNATSMKLILKFKVELGHHLAINDLLEEAVAANQGGDHGEDGDNGEAGDIGVNDGNDEHEDDGVLYPGHNVLINLSLDYQIDGLLFDFPLLTKLSLDGESVWVSGQSNSNSLITENGALKIASKFPSLKVLKIGSQCKRVTITHFWQRAMKAFPKITKVVIRKPSIFIPDLEILRGIFAHMIPTDEYFWTLKKTTFIQLTVERKRRSLLAITDGK